MLHDLSRTVEINEDPSNDIVITGFCDWVNETTCVRHRMISRASLKGNRTECGMSALRVVLEDVIPAPHNGEIWSIGRPMISRTRHLVIISYEIQYDVP